MLPIVVVQVKYMFVQRAIERRVIETAVTLIEQGSSELAEVACDFLGAAIAYCC